MTQAVSQTDGLEVSQTANEPWLVYRRITAVSSTFIDSNTSFTISQLSSVI
jgi:hypothetical protein